MINNIIKILIDNVTKVLEASYGQMLFFFSLITFSFETKIGFAIVGGAVIADLIWGVSAAIKLKKFVLSRALRETFTKSAIYAFALIGIALIEKFIYEESLIGVKIACSLAAACELWSISASMLIIKPNMPFIKIFRLQLKGEIENKIGKNIKNILNDEETDI